MVSDSERSDFTAINSSDEFPTDSIGDVLVVSTKGVLKEIIKCGNGYGKPGIGDEVTFEYNCIKKGGENCDAINESENKKITTILGDINVEDGDFMGSNFIPWGLELALRKMLKGEESKILIKKDSVFSYQREIEKDGNKDMKIIPLESFKNNYERSRRLVDLIKKKTEEFDVYYVKLIDFCYIESINDKMKKRILKAGIRLRSPSRNDSVDISLSTIKSSKTICVDDHEVVSNGAISEDWRRIKLDLRRMNDNEEFVKWIGSLKSLISLQDFLELMLSMRVGEVSQVKIKGSIGCHDDKSTDTGELDKYVLIHFHGYYWERDVKFKYPFDTQAPENSENEKKTDFGVNDRLVISSYDAEEDMLVDSIMDESSKVPRRISSINFEYDTRLNVEISEFKVVNKTNTKEHNIGIPIAGLPDHQSSRSVILRISPGHYTTPLWLEYSLLHCCLGGSYTLSIPYSLIFFFPPSSKHLGRPDFGNHHEDIAFSTRQLCVTQSIKEEADKEKELEMIEVHWDLGILSESLREIGLYDETCPAHSCFFQLNLSIRDKNIHEKFTPFSLKRVEKEFYYYYYMALKMNTHIDYKYNKNWNLLSLEYFDKVLYILKLLPIYSRMQISDNPENSGCLEDSKEFDREGNNENNGRADLNQNVSGSIFRDQDTAKSVDNIIEGAASATFRLPGLENKELEIIVCSLKLAYEICFELKDYAKCIYYYQNYKLFSLYDLKNVFYAFISSIKLGNSHLTGEISNYIRAKIRDNDVVIDALYESSRRSGDEMVQRVSELFG